MTQDVSIEAHGAVSIIRINRPGHRNALTLDVVRKLQDAFADFDRSEQRVAVLCGEGDNFSMGSDPTLPVAELWRCMPTIGLRTEKPIIAAVNGECRGAAFSIAMMADITIAADNAAFCYPKGIHGATGALVASLACRIPHKYAMEIMLMGGVISGRRAFEMGLANAVVPDGEHVSTALQWAEVMATRAPMVLALLKQFVGQTLPKGPSEIQAITIRDLTMVRTSDDSAEGKRAMAEGRTPVFQGR
ncbi:enoyl-CoA hydratase/isomerase family protein [Neorhizobium sp. DT-125]|uniref:enoyl-CoA hydratase/isomerase family protein n=1 Tax=Neorhizobium sp. DT-125 TaxID=3396163 RepID=UPI003F1AA6F5